MCTDKTKQFIASSNYITCNFCEWPLTLMKCQMKHKNLGYYKNRFPACTQCVGKCGHCLGYLYQWPKNIFPKFMMYI